MPPSRRALMLASAAALWPAHARAGLDWNLRGTTTGSGKLQREQRTVEPFKALRLGGSLKVELLQGETERVEIETDDNLQPLIEVSVRGGTLHIVQSRGMKPTRLAITVHARQLDSIRVAGSSAVLAERWTAPRLRLNGGGAGVIKLARLAVERLELDAGGSSVLNLGGAAGELVGSLGGASALSAKHLQLGRADMRLGGSAQAVLWVTESLKARVGGAGGLRYYGSPKLESARSGAGVVARLGAQPAP